jgi:hypothetical protein
MTEWMMPTIRDPSIKFPVSCPHCRAEIIGEFTVAEVASALLSRDQELRLYAPCHRHYWSASPMELHQIRQYPWAWLQEGGTGGGDSS